MSGEQGEGNGLAQRGDDQCGNDTPRNNLEPAAEPERSHLRVVPMAGVTPAASRRISPVGQATGSIVTGIAFRTALPDSGSRSCSSVRSFKLTPAFARAMDIRAPGALCPQPCGKLATPGIISSL